MIYLNVTLIILKLKHFFLRIRFFLWEKFFFGNSILFFNSKKIMWPPINHEKSCKIWTYKVPSIFGISNIEFSHVCKREFWFDTYTTLKLVKCRSEDMFSINSFPSRHFRSYPSKLWYIRYVYEKAMRSYRDSNSDCWIQSPKW